MRSILLLICLSFFQSETLSQKLVLPDKKWEGPEMGNFSNFYQGQFRNSSKEIGGKEYLELMFKTEDGWFEGARQYYREEGDKIYRLYDGEEKLILDFGLSVGDTMEIEDDFGERYKFFPIRTTDTLIFNKQLRKLEMRVQPINEPVSTTPHVWIEGVGDTGFFFGFGHVFGNQNASPVFCVRESGLFFTTGIGCPNILLSTDSKPIKESDFEYNPLAKVLQLKNEDITQLDIYSITGERIGSNNINAANTEISTSLIDQPICVVVVFDGKSYRSRIIIL